MLSLQILLLHGLTWWKSTELDAQDKAVDVCSHLLTGIHLNSFTLDMLTGGESSKSSIFCQACQLSVEN